MNLVTDFLGMTKLDQKRQKMSGNGLRLKVHVPTRIQMSNLSAGNMPFDEVSQSVRVRYSYL